MPLELATVIAQVESGTNSKRLRFEPSYHDLWGVRPAQFNIDATICRIHACSHATAAVIASTSWGMFQILGANIYDVCAYDRTVFDFCADPAAQAFAFRAYLIARKIDFSLEEIQADPAKRTAFISAYNGPGAVDAYWANMQAAIQSLGRHS